MKCRWCGQKIHLEDGGTTGEARYFHNPPYLWGSHQSRIPSPLHSHPPGEPVMFFVKNPCWQNGLYCDPDYTHYAEPADEQEEQRP